MYRNKRKSRTKLSESAQAYRICKRGSEPPSEEIGDRRNAKGQKKRKNRVVLSRTVRSFQRLAYNQPAKRDMQEHTGISFKQTSCHICRDYAGITQESCHHIIHPQTSSTQQCDPQLTKHLLDELDITPIDTMTDRFADSFSYY